MEELDTNAPNAEHVGMACPKCQPSINFSPLNRHYLIKHIKAHILHNTSVDSSSEPCELCLHPVPLCKILFKKARGWMGKLAINMKSSSCPNLIKFSIANVAACFETSPCTNHPMKCPYCPKLNPAVWSYTFCHHLCRFHPSIHLSDHNSLWTPLKLEKDGIKCIWQHRHKQPKLHQREQCPSLIISETHHMQFVLRYSNTND